MSPLESESRIAAQFAPFITIELIPYFLNRPFSWAITIGEQSVSAIMPNFRLAVSGASLAKTLPAHPLGNPCIRVAIAEPPIAPFRNFRRLVSGHFETEFIFFIR